MEILYMQKLEQWKEKYNRGVAATSERVQQIETTYDIVFPQAYKEYLLISGEYFPGLVIGHRLKHAEDDQKRAQDLLQEYKLTHLITKPFWVVGDTDISFFYIHLDEGDNPPVYRLTPEDYEDYQDEKTFGKIYESFQEWIEFAINNYELKQED